jgi:hypothetical protein
MRYLAFAAVVAVMAACSSRSTGPAIPPSVPRLNASADSAAVLAASARERVSVDNNFGGAAFATVYVFDKLGAPIGPKLDFTAPSTIADAERDAVTKALAPTRAEWIADHRTLLDLATTIGSRPTIPILYLGVPVLTGDTAQVVSSLWCGTTCTAGGAHLLVRGADGTWQVNGRVEAQ